MTPTDGLIGLCFLMGFIILWTLKMVWEQNFEIRKMNDERKEVHDFYREEILSLWFALDKIGVSDRIKTISREDGAMLADDLESMSSERVDSPPGLARSVFRKDSRPDSG